MPSFRRDIFRAEDVIEEIARHVGYDNLPEAFPRPHMKTGLIDDDLRLRREIKDIMVRLGLWELNSFPLGTETSMTRPNPFLAGVQPARITNPITEDASILRMSLVSGVVDTYVRNLRRGSPICDVFEIGTVYWRDDEDFRERREVIIGVLGDRAGKKKERTRERGFLQLKGYVESILEAVGVSDYDFVPDQSAPKGIVRYIVQRGNTAFGFLEAIPEDTLGGDTFERPIFTAVFPWSAIKDAYVESQLKKAFKLLPNFPAVERDLAFVLDESVAYRRMTEAVHHAAGEYLERLSVFDVYRGKQVGEGKKNLAINLKFRHPERTLTDVEVDGWIEEIVKLVLERTGGKIRDW